ncbi:UNVERIFIED_CONTAM: hypothetical protein PYX00_008871 [Menopon gallinae]|uniref:Uncharacterized protein n=1 Tax=Menopon gallinae TaxID=328185 RepID=A0AAW2H8Y5_9NEOP
MPIKEDQQYSSDIYDCSEDRCIEEAQTSSCRDHIILNEKDNRSLNENEMVVTDKPDENYFTKNFDECMKRLQIIEKEQEIMEAEAGRTLNVYNFKKPPKRQMTPPAEESSVPPPEHASQETVKEEVGGEEMEQKTSRAAQTTENGEGRDEKPTSTSTSKEPTVNMSHELPNESSTRNTGWYSNLRRQFENETKAKESSCRVTGATLKTASPQTLENDSKDVKHYFSRLVRSNKSLIDEELPDPDKVQNIRAMFQESLNSTLQKNINRFGGSLQNINAKQTAEDQFARPKSAQGNSKDFVAEFPKMKKEEEAVVPGPGRTVPEDRAVLKGHNKAHPKNQARVPEKSRRFPQSRWTDTTSLSSGVSSDFSSYETDAECCSREEIEENTTDEELHDDGEDKHYVRSETLEKIRSFGTSVTYFGGQMITCSVGPLLSPTTQAILDEIGEKYPDRKNFTRTFEEFYRKYTENNNELRRKKLGRARSFGQNDVFHKPNILSNTEIDMYKNDLEVEIGIRKPSGKNQNTLRQKLVKSNSVGSRFEFFEREVAEKLNEILETAVEMAGKSEEETPKGTVKTAVAEEEPANESQILFGYDKEAFDRERKTDMEFEEFEVCETVEEKIEKLEDDSQNYRLTIRVNQDDPEEAVALEEIVINDQEPLDSLEIYLKTRKCDYSDSRCTNFQVSECRHPVPDCRRPSAGSKWPIETTVMVDIQKNEEQMPKLIAAGKSSVKTKTRSFKK